MVRREGKDTSKRLNEGIEEWRSPPAAKCHAIKDDLSCTTSVWDSWSILSLGTLKNSIFQVCSHPSNSFRKRGKKVKIQCLLRLKQTFSVPHFFFFFYLYTLLPNKQGRHWFNCLKNQHVLEQIAWCSW